MFNDGFPIHLYLPLLLGGGHTQIYTTVQFYKMDSLGLEIPERVEMKLLWLHAEIGH